MAKLGDSSGKELIPFESGFDGNNYELEDGDLSWPNMLCILGNKIVKKQQ